MKPIRCLITAGPTREHLDPVRFLSNGSSGKMGYALAEAALELKWTVDLVSGPVALSAPPETNLIRVVSAEEMLHACEPLFVQCDFFICVAAVADYRPKNRETVKSKKTPGHLSLELEPTVDILKTLAAKKTGSQKVIGFAAETHEMEISAQRKLVEKKLDWIVANDVSQPGIGMNADENKITLIASSGERRVFGPASKKDVARFILSQLVRTSR